jgi:hypothetical protein
MLIQVVLPIDEEWQECLNTIPHDFYHLPGYLELEATRQKAKAEAIIIKSGEELFFLAYLVRDCSQVSALCEFDGDRVYDVISPYGYPGMLVSRSGQNPQFIRKCLNIIYEHWRSKNICSAFIRLHPILNSCLDQFRLNNSSFLASDIVLEKLHQRGDVVICELERDLTEIWKQIRSNHRTKINKLKRSGFTVSMGSVDEYLDVFIDIYIETMNRVNAGAAYFFTRDYFNQFSAVLGDRLNICVVKINEEIVAASLITEFSGIVQYHLGGTRTEFLPQSPTTIMFDYMIHWGKQRDNQYLNLGGGLGGTIDSLYHFKSGFSNYVQSFITIETIINPDLYDQLIHSRAKSLGIPISEITTKPFFPAYRYKLS